MHIAYGSYLQGEEVNGENRIYIVSEEGEILDHIQGGKMNDMDSNIRVETLVDWRDEETTPYVQLETTGQDLEQA